VNQKDIFVYLKELYRAEKWKTMKVHFLGDGNTGKSTLMKALQSKSKPDNIATDGIDIENWKCSNDLQFTFWDFGGQEM
jgi:GTPase SAR1 family protein